MLRNENFINYNFYKEPLKNMKKGSILMSCLIDYIPPHL